MEKQWDFHVDYVTTSHFIQFLGFKYEMQIVADGMFGHSHEGKWNGLIGEVQDGRATIAAAPLTITSER